MDHVVEHLLLAAVLPSGDTTEVRDVDGEHVEADDEARPGCDKEFNLKNILRSK